MKILWLTWKDINHPLAGGAEVVATHLAQKLVADGHEVIFLTSGYQGASTQESVNGYQIIRVGNRLTVYWQAYRYYKKHLQGWAGLVIDEMNTVPFFTKYYVSEPHLMLVHMLCRQIWWHEAIFPFNFIGYLLEPLYLRLLSDQKVITVSNSTKQDLQRFGFRESNIHIISEGIELNPVRSLVTITKFDTPTILAFGGLRSMKRPHHIIQAFELAKEKQPNLKLIVAGAAQGKYGQYCLQQIQQSPHRQSITYAGRVSTQEKINLMQQCHIVCVASIKEGWGLVVTEANSQGTPAIVYDVDGLRDSVRHKQTGLVCRDGDIQAMAESILALIKNPELYQRLQHNAWAWSLEISFERSYTDFSRLTQSAV